MVSHQERRMEIIKKIENTLRTLEEKGIVYDEEKLLSEICKEYGSTWSKAKEYLKIAQTTSKLTSN